MASGRRGLGYNPNDDPRVVGAALQRSADAAARIVRNERTAATDAQRVAETAARRMIATTGRRLLHSDADVATADADVLNRLIDAQYAQRDVTGRPPPSISHLRANAALAAKRGDVPQFALSASERADVSKVMHAANELFRHAHKPPLPPTVRAKLPHGLAAAKRYTEQLQRESDAYRRAVAGYIERIIRHANAIGAMSAPWAAKYTRRAERYRSGHRDRRLPIALTASVEDWATVNRDAARIRANCPARRISA